MTIVRLELDTFHTRLEDRRSVLDSEELGQAIVELEDQSGEVPGPLELLLDALDRLVPVDVAQDHQDPLHLLFHLRESHDTQFDEIASHLPYLPLLPSNR